MRDQKRYAYLADKLSRPAADKQNPIRNGLAWKRNPLVHSSLPLLDAESRGNPAPARFVRRARAFLRINRPSADPTSVVCRSSFRSFAGLNFLYTSNPLSHDRHLQQLCNSALHWQPNHQYVSPGTICNNNQQMEGVPDRIDRSNSNQMGGLRVKNKNVAFVYASGQPGQGAACTRIMNSINYRAIVSWKRRAFAQGTIARRRRRRTTAASCCLFRSLYSDSTDRW
jgi:hypothetical protein